MSYCNLGLGGWVGGTDLLSLASSRAVKTSRQRRVKVPW